jgi:predicted nucleic acid-binding protein
MAKHIMHRAALGSCLTMQSISEFFIVATRKGMMRRTEAVPVAEAMMTLFRTASPSARAVQASLRFAASGRASYWDALLIHTAAEATCTAILTEDLPDGTVMAGVRIVNPFGIGTSLPRQRSY